jgi:hypothetical protein
MKKVLLFLMLFAHIGLFAQDNNQYGKSFTFNLNSFKSNASKSIQSNGLAAKITARFSLPDGKTEDFVFNETLITSKKLNVVQTYDATSEDGKKIMKLTVIGDKLEGIMHTPEGYFYIETIDAKANLYRIYSHEELPSDKFKIGCGATDDDFKPKKNGRILSVAPFPYGTQLKRFTAAIVVTKEMTNLYTTQDLALAQTVSIANANNLIYELEAAMTFVLATQTTDKTIVFTNANPGPTEFGTINVPNCQAGFTALNTSNILPYNTYGIGHTLNTLPALGGGSFSGNGVAGPTPCVDASKSRGYTQWTFGSPLSLIINIFTHELGHQFSAPHTYNAIGGTATDNTFCLVGWSSTSAIEPGSGTTMMSYANNCVNPTVYTLNGNNKLQYFNTKSLEFMRNAIASTSGGCATNVALVNTPPVAGAGTAITIPKSTPFTLKGTGTDANNDVLTYTWEQYDVAAEADKGLLGSTAINSTTAPLFRSEQSSTTTSRDFPRISNILTGNTTLDASGEALPAVARAMKFRFTVRDNKTGGGGVDSDEVIVTVSNTGPFELTSFNTAQTIAAGSSQTITWDVNNTNTISANVRILLSIDEGASFNYLLAASVPNNGSATVTIPANVPSTTFARIKIMSLHHPTASFFDINNANITITSSCLAANTFICPEATVSGVSGNPVFNLGLGFATGSKVATLNKTYPTTGLPPTTYPLINYTNNSFTTCQVSGWPQVQAVIVPFRVTKTGNHSISVAGTGGGVVYSIFTSNTTFDCTTFVGGNSHSAISWINPRPIPLNECTTYYALLYVIGGNGGVATAATFNIQSQVGGEIIEIQDNPAGFNYTYFALSQANDQIAAVSATANFTTLTGGQYKVYGLTYTTGLNPNTLLNKTLIEAYGLGNCMVQSQNTKTLIVTPVASPCPPTLTLVTPTDDKSSGTTTFQASQTITASNKITGSANVTMRAANAVELKPSGSGGGTTFEAANGTVFQALIGGCAN